MNGKIVSCFSAVFLISAPFAARAAESDDFQQLKKEVQELRKKTEQLEEKLRHYESATNHVAPEVMPSASAAPAAGETNNAPAAAVPESPQAWSPAQPISILQAGKSYLNLSFDALTDFGWSSVPRPWQQLELGDHDPKTRGFTMPNAEIVLDGAVDPYFRGAANIVLKLDKDSNTDIELEETYLETMTLPANMQVKGGLFFANFGRQNPQHPHQWAFVDQPLILTRAFGPDGLRNLGAQVSWLAPTPFYLETFLGIFNGAGETAFGFRNQGDPDMLGIDRVHGRATMDRQLRGPSDLLFVPRVASSVDLTDTQTLLMGASGAFGPNDTGGDTRTQVYGLDAYWKWKSSSASKGFPFVSLQAEGLYSEFDAGADPAAPVPLPSETLRDWGFYSQALWGFMPRWVAGLRGEYVTGDQGAFDALDPFRGDRSRVSPNLTFYPSEFSKVRLQYNYDRSDHFGDAHSVWLQFEFLLGAHGAHKF